MKIAADAKAWLGKNLATKSDYSLVEQNKERQTLVAATGVGVAAGAAAGLGAGTLATALNEKSEFTVQREVYDPTLVGHSHESLSVVARVDLDGKPKSWDYQHSYSPEYSNRVVGGYEMPGFRDSIGLTPMTGAVLGAAGGGLLGLGVGVALNVMNRVSKDASDRGRVGVELESLKEMIDNDTANVVKGAAIGLGIGAGVGWGAGQLEALKGSPVTRTYVGPVTQEAYMGDIPADVTTPSRVNGLESIKSRPVYAQIPVYDEHGELRFEEKTEALGRARFSPLKSAVVGGVVGLGAGVAGSLAYNVLQRVSAYEPLKSS